MKLLDTIFSPSGYLARTLFALALLVGASLVAIILLSFYVVYHVVTPLRVSADIPPDQVFLKPAAVDFSTPSGSREGWFFPGLKGAPTILVCHGYGSSRGELLTLASALQEHQYNVFIFDFAGHGKSSGSTSFGPAETQEILAALDAVAGRDDVEKDRFGIWGVDQGGYAAMSAATKDKRIQALAVESVFDSPSQMLMMQLERTGMTRAPLLGHFAQWIFTAMHFFSRNDPPLSEKVKLLAGIPKLFIQTRTDPRLTEVTRELFMKAPEPREQAIMPRPTYASMLQDEKKEYESTVVAFFLTNLPVSGRGVSPPPAGSPR
ncbi:MAG: alpha/beta fold hydrolase [Acidobacteria bacterium]|nr:alpha/beta fold hydrolase [Acidobacteriota bacterium]